jgi:phage terminase small subunit
MTKTAKGAVGLTARQSRFVDEYLKDLDAAEAYQRADYKAKGRSAENAASRLLGNVGIQEAIQERMDRRSERTQIDADYVLHRLAEIDQMDVADILNDDGSVKAVKDWPRVWRTYVSGMDLSEVWEGSGDDRQTVGMLKKIKWPDKVKNLELLGRHVGVQAFKERVEHDVSDSLADKLEAARQRALKKRPG